MDLNRLKVSVPREDLLAKLKENRAKHIDLFQKAMAGYVKLTIRELEEKLADVKAGKDISRYMVNVAPESHEDDYDDAIGMLEMANDAEIELDQQQFRQFVRDDWGWKAQWLQTSTTYAAAR